MDICEWKYKFFKKKFIEPPIYIGKLRLICGGISLNFFKKPPTIIGNFREKSWWFTQNFSRKKLYSYYNWTFRYRKCKVFRKKLKHSPHILDIYIHVCGGAPPNFFKKSPTIIGNFREKSKWSTQNFSRKKLLSHYNWTLAARNLTVYRKNLLTIYGHLHIVWRGFSGRNKSPPTYIGKLQCFCWGISLNFCKKISST